MAKATTKATPETKAPAPIELELPDFQPLHVHASPEHEINNANETHAAELEAKRKRRGVYKYVKSFNQWLAVSLTNGVGTMACAYLFMVLAILGFPGWQSSVHDLIQWISQTFIQLVMLAVLAVAQRILGRKQEIQSDEMYNASMRTEHNSDQMVLHQDAQDRELQKLSFLLTELLKAHNIHVVQQTGETSVNESTVETTAE